MSSSQTFTLEPWKNLTKSNFVSCNSSRVRFEREELLTKLILNNVDGCDFHCWVFPGHIFVTYEKSNENNLLTFDVQVINESKCESSFLDIKNGGFGNIVNISENSTSGDARFWLTFESGLLQEWVFASFHSCESTESPHRGWTLAAETHFLDGGETRIVDAGVVTNTLLWTQRDGVGPNVAGTVSLWRLSLPTTRCDVDEEAEVTFGSPVPILRGLPPCRLKTFYGLAVLWTNRSTNSVDGFAFIVNPTTSSLRLLDTSRVGGLNDVDFEGSQLGDWLTMRRCDALREISNDAVVESRHSNYPREFLFDPKSRSLILLRNDGSVFERKTLEHVHQPEIGGWHLVTKLELEDNLDVAHSAITLTRVKRERFLASIRKGDDRVDVFHVDSGRKLPVASAKWENLPKSGFKLANATRFCLGQMQFPLLIQPAVGLFKVAITITKDPDDFLQSGFIKVLADVDRFVEGGAGIKRDEMANAISAAMSSSRANALTNTLKPDLEAILANLQPFENAWRGDFHAQKREKEADEEEECTGLSGSSTVDFLSDTFLRDFSSSASPTDEELEDPLRHLLHRLEFLSRSYPLEVLSSLLSRLEAGESEAGTERDLVEPSLFFASSSPSSSSSSSASNPVHSSLFSLCVALALEHRPSTFASVMEVVGRLCEEADDDAVSELALDHLKILRSRMEREGSFESAFTLKRFLTATAPGDEEKGDEESDLAERMKGLVEEKQWDACVSELVASKNEGRLDDTTYVEAFEICIEGIFNSSIVELEGFESRYELLKLIPKNFDIRIILDLCGRLDRRECNFEPICTKSGCKHFMVKDLTT